MLLLLRTYYDLGLGLMEHTTMTLGQARNGMERTMTYPKVIVCSGRAKTRARGRPSVLWAKARA